MHLVRPAAVRAGLGVRDDERVCRMDADHLEGVPLQPLQLEARADDRAAAVVDGEAQCAALKEQVNAEVGSGGVADGCVGRLQHWRQGGKHGLQRFGKLADVRVGQVARGRSQLGGPVVSASALEDGGG